MVARRGRVVLCRAGWWMTIGSLSKSLTSEELAQNGLASRRPIRKFLFGFGAALGGLCASEELAQNGVRRGRVPDPVGGARRALCAFI